MNSLQSDTNKSNFLEKTAIFVIKLFLLFNSASLNSNEVTQNSQWMWLLMCNLRYNPLTYETVVMTTLKANGTVYLLSNRWGTFLTDSSKWSRDFTVFFPLARWKKISCQNCTTGGCFSHCFEKGHWKDSCLWLAPPNLFTMKVEANDSERHREEFIIQIEVYRDQAIQVSMYQWAAGTSISNPLPHIWHLTLYWPQRLPPTDVQCYMFLVTHKKLRKQSNTATR